MLEHRFGGRPFTIGIEEELMLVDSESMDLASGIEEVLAKVPDEHKDQVKPELLQSVLEVATGVCDDIDSAGRELRELRSLVHEAVAEAGMLIGASGTHPFAHWDQQKIVDRPRYQELAVELGYIAKRELIFGTHVHVGIDGPDKAIYVADGIRRFLPLMLALSANSPFWKGRRTGMMSTRTPIFRAFPRVGVPPYFGDWEVYCNRVELLCDSGAIEDYTYLWWDVRPHPNLGTVEIRVFDQQTRLEHTLALAALCHSLVHRLAADFDEGKPSREHPTELIDDNKVRAALRGLDAKLVDTRRRTLVPARQMAAELIDELREHAEELGCAASLAGVQLLIDQGAEAQAQLDAYERADHDLTEVVRDLIDRTH